MAALRSLTLPLGPFFSADGKLAVGHAVACYNPGTDTLRTWYADAALTTPAPNPDRTGSDGRLAQKFLGVGPSEIRQYAPVSASSTIPNDLQYFPGTEWALVETWLEDGLVADAGSTIYTVDTVDELRALTDPAAIDGLVAVIGYSSASDEIGVRYYLRDQYSVASDDGGAVLNALAGGRWILKTDWGEVDARVWGVMANGADVTSNLAAAASWANANGATLYIAPGVYTVSSGSIAIANAHIADGVQIKATSGAYSVELTGHWAVDGTGALQHANSTGDVRLAFGASADVGTAYMSWNGTDGDLGYYPGQNVVHSADSTGLLTIDGPLSLASFTLAKDTNSSITGNVEIGVLHCNGYTLSATDDGTLTIGVFDRAGTDPVGLDWDAGDAPTVRVLYDFRTSDVDANALDRLDGNYSAVVLTVDANRTVSRSLNWAKVTLQSAGGVLSASADTVDALFADVRGDGAVFGSGWSNGTAARILLSTWGSLRAVHFGASLGNGSFASITANHSGAEVDLEGWTANVSQLWLSSNPRIRNGKIDYSNNSGIVLTSGLELADLTLKMNGTLVVADGGGLQMVNCAVDVDTANSSFIQIGKSDDTVGGEIGIFENCVFGKHARLHSVAGSTAPTPPSVRAVDCVFKAGFHDSAAPLELTGDITLERCTVSCVVFLTGAPRYVRIHDCLFVMQPGDTSLITSLIDVSDVTDANDLHPDIADNQPQRLLSSDTLSKYWPQTRGHFRALSVTTGTPSSTYRTGMFAGVGSGGAVIRASGSYTASVGGDGYVGAVNSTEPQGGVVLYPVSSEATIDVLVMFDISK